MTHRPLDEARRQINSYNLTDILHSLPSNWRLQYLSLSIFRTSLKTLSLNFLRSTETNDKHKSRPLGQFSPVPTAPTKGLNYKVRFGDGGRGARPHLCQSARCMSHCLDKAFAMSSESSSSCSLLAPEHASSKAQCMLSFQPLGCLSRAMSATLYAKQPS